MEILVITGYSGAGKSVALDVVEDLGYFSMDNLPPSLLEKFIDLAIESPKIHKVAVVMDTRAGVFFSNLPQAIEKAKDKKIKVSILFLSASEDVIVARYKERRRPHPLGDSIVEGYRKERQELENIKNQADIVIDTSNLSTNQFKQRLTQELASKDQAKLRVTINSFGFKYGILQDADIIFDVRFLPNPYYIPELKKLNGLNKETQDFVLSKAQSQEFLDRLYDLFVFLIPHYIEEGKRQLVIGLGCTGGFHRSVAMTEALAKRLEKLDLLIQTRHRDMESGD
ncbi:MAG: RNase adapter RapZ [Peptoniphilus sp. oral taxon 375]|nr:RNase adapter RapZ [Peptoniphilus sp. oral taxon 375]